MSNEAWHQAVFWYGVSMLPRLRRLTSEQRLQVMKEADEHNNVNPLFLCSKPQFAVPSWSEKPLTGGQVTALLVYGMWVQVGENEQSASGLMSDWPEIKMACTLVGPQPMKEESDE